MSTALEKATVPVSVVCVLLTGILSYWVAASDKKVDDTDKNTVENTREIAKLKVELVKQRTEVNKDIADIKEKQAVQVTVQQHILDTLKRIEEKVDKDERRR